MGYSNPRSLANALIKRPVVLVIFRTDSHSGFDRSPSKDATQSQVTPSSLNAMTYDPYKVLESLNIELPQPATPKGSYMPMVIHDAMAYLSGALPTDQNGELLAPGVVGINVSLEEAAAAARLCALNLMARLQADLGSLAKVRRWIKITGFVASAPSFTGQPQVINGASDFLVEVFGDLGKHARSAVGVAALPLGSSVEIEAIVEIWP